MLYINRRKTEVGGIRRHKQFVKGGKKINIDMEENFLTGP